jgi:hypothetical protein
METVLSPEEIKKLMQVKGEVRGVVFKTDLEYIFGQKGQEGLQKLKEELQRTNFPLDPEKIEMMTFYPIGLRAISLLVIKKLFSLSDEEIKRMGAAAPKFSLIIKLFTKYFLSITATARQAPSMWKRHYRAGELLIIEINETEKRIILRLVGLDLHPVFCQYLTGYFLTVVKMVVGQPVSSEETRCVFRGDDYHEYLITW